ncbi:UNVERIFIED_CONTAM: Protein COP1 SUPPRESSOR 2, partial [Sesamum indicum]
SALALEEVKFLQRQREKKLGIPALVTSALSASAGAGVTHGSTGGLARNVNDKSEGDVEKDDLVLQDTFAQETAVMVEDPNMLRYVEQELAKKKGKNIDVENQVESDVKRAEDELYKIPEHLKVKRRSSQENSTQWTTGIAEVQLPIEYKLRNIEETEAAKKLLQEKRYVGRAKAESSIPSSFSSDFFQHGKDYAEKHRKGGFVFPYVTHHAETNLNHICGFTRIRVEMVRNLDMLIHFQMLQVEGKLPLMNSCWSASGNEKDNVSYGDSLSTWSSGVNGGHFLAFIMVVSASIHFILVSFAQEKSKRRDTLACIQPSFLFTSFSSKFVENWRYSQ